MAPLIALISVASFSAFLNGFHDSGNVVATIISSRAMSPRKALALSALAHFLSPFLFGLAVAETIGEGVVEPKSITLITVLSGLISVIVWSIITWLLGIPSSFSHALIGGILGAVSVGDGFGMIKTSGLIKVITALLISPIFGMIAGYLLMKFALLLLRGASPGVNRLFKRLQLLTSLALALSQGTNDAQRTIGMIAMGLVATGYLSGFSIPNWVVFLSAAALSLGTAAGGWRIIKTMGTRFYKIRPLHGFSAQAASAAVILGAALLGGPVSTTQVVCSTIMGVGSAERLSKVRWKVARNIFAAWFLTIPLTALLAALIYLIAWIIFPK